MLQIQEDGLSSTLLTFHANIPPTQLMFVQERGHLRSQGLQKEAYSKNQSMEAEQREAQEPLFAGMIELGVHSSVRCLRDPNSLGTELRSRN